MTSPAEGTGEGEEEEQEGEAGFLANDELRISMSLPSEEEGEDEK